MEHLSTEDAFEGRLRIVGTVTNGEPEEKGGYLYFHNIARAAVYWWLCDESDSNRLSDKVLVVCDIAEPAEPSEEPAIAVGEDVSATFPVTIRALVPGLDAEALLAEARRVAAQKVSEGADDFEGLENFRVEIDAATADERRAEAA